MSGRDFIQNPGPTNIPERVLRAMARPAVDFGTPEFLELLDGCLERLRCHFGTDGPIVGYTSTGHGAWEAVVVNLMEAGDRVVLCDAGLFSSRWGDMATAHGMRVERLVTGERRGVDPDDLRRCLEADDAGSIRAVMVAQIETSTGALSDVGALRRVIDEVGHRALFLVDAIASFATTPLDMSADGVDVGLAASQKGLMMPVGLSFSALSPRAVERAHACETPRYYWDWRVRLAEEGYRKFCGTPPIHHLFGLREALDLIDEEGGLDAVVARHHLIAEAVRAAVECWSQAGALELNVTDPAQRADAITCVRVDPAFDADAVVWTAREQFNVTVGSGLGPMAGRAFRIGHLGDLHVPMILGALGGNGAALRRVGVPVGAGGLDAATCLLAGGT